MKRKILFGGCFFLIAAALFSITITPLATGQANAGRACDERLITALNPAIATRVAERVPLGPRLATLEGKTIYLLDMQWGGPEAAYSVYEEMQGWFARNMPSVKVQIRRISGGPFATDDPGLGKEITAKKVDAAFIGIGG